MFGKKKKQSATSRVSNKDRLEKLEQDLSRLQSSVARLESNIRRIECSHPIEYRKWVETCINPFNISAPYQEKCGRCQVVLNSWYNRDAFLQAKVAWHKKMGNKLEEVSDGV